VQARIDGRIFWTLFVVGNISTFAFWDLR
jgi:hypothetical protein